MENTARLRILLATENVLFRECLADRLSREGRYRVATAQEGPEIFSHLKFFKPHLVIFDLDALGPLPESLLTRMRHYWPESTILAISEHAGDATVARILRAGATGFLCKKENVKSLLRAMEALSRGETWAGRLATARALREIAGEREQRSPGDLTAREKQILGLLRDGYRNKEIARLLRIEERTVKAHLHSLFRKLNVRTRVEAALHAGGR